MAVVIADRVKVRSFTNGTGPLTLGPTVPGFQSFEAVGNGNETYYSITSNANEWEVGRGTYTKVGIVETLTRDTIISSSNNNLIVNFTGGGKNVFCTLPSSVAQSFITGSVSDSFKTISVATQPNVVADSATDTLTLVAGSGISITTNAGSDSITISNTSSLGSIDVVGSTLSTNDSSGIVIDQAVNITSDLEVGGDITPSTDLGGNLGSPTQRFKDLYLSGSTINLGGATISSINGEISTSSLNIGGVSLSSSVSGTLVIPGVTRIANYQVEEVQEIDNQSLTFLDPPIVLDAVTYTKLVDGVDPATLSAWVSQYGVSLDDDDYIDFIDVQPTAGSTYNEGEATVNSTVNMWAYTGLGAIPDPITTFTPSDWTQIPFRPQMQARETEADPEFSSASLGNLIISDNTESNNESVVFTTSVQGSTISIRNTETAADQFDGDIIFNSEPHPGSVIGSGGYVRIAPNRINLDVGSNDLNLRSDGLDFDGGYALTQTQGNFVAAESTDVVFEATDTAGTPKVIKLIIKVNKNDDYQACEMLIVRSNDVLPVVNYTVYGLVHTTAEPFATLAAEWSTLLSKIVVIATNPSATDGIFVESMAIEITDWD